MNMKFSRSQKCEQSSLEIKTLLALDKVMAVYDPSRENQVYVVEGPEGVSATVAQQYSVEGIDHAVWRPVHLSSRTKTAVEYDYGKVDGELLGVLSGVLSNRNVPGRAQSWARSLC